MAGRADPFDWSGGDPALDFVNTLDERPSGAPIENLAAYGDLVRFAELAGIIEPSASERLRSRKGPACSRIARRARELREQLHAVLAAAHLGQTAPKAALEAITLEVRRAHAARTLVATEPSSAVKHVWLAPFSPEVPLYACALAIETLLVTADHGRIRKCGASDCDVYFIDTSKAHRRQWCSMQNCGNREKQRRWRSGAE
jgi:predicted RNA-binding Zn ribbon-like protein